VVLGEAADSPPATSETPLLRTHDIKTNSALFRALSSHHEAYDCHANYGCNFRQRTSWNL